MAMRISRMAQQIQGLHTRYRNAVATIPKRGKSDQRETSLIKFWKAKNIYHRIPEWAKAIHQWTNARKIPNGTDERGIQNTPQAVDIIVVALEVMKFEAKDKMIVVKCLEDIGEELKP